MKAITTVLVAIVFLAACTSIQKPTRWKESASKEMEATSEKSTSIDGIPTYSGAPITRNTMRFDEKSASKKSLYFSGPLDSAGTKWVVFKFANNRWNVSMERRIPDQPAVRF